MKKWIIYSLCVCMLLLSLSSCNSQDAENSKQDSPTVEATLSKTQLEYECGKKAYDELVTASEICKAMGDGVYGAWYFAIFEADDYSSYNIVNEFASATGVSVSDLNKVMESIGYSAQLLPYALEDFSTAVVMVEEAYKINGTVERLDNALTQAKNELKTMTQEYSDYSHYPTLKSFYSEIDSYATFLKSPTGSFDQLKSTIENYENQIRTYKSDLSFVFED